MPRMTTADAAVAILRREGVRCVFGLPGAAINPDMTPKTSRRGLTGQPGAGRQRERLQRRLFPSG